MFDSDLNYDAARQKVTRRAFLLSGGMAAAAIAAWSLHPAPTPPATSSQSGPAPEVAIAEFSSAGVPTGTVRVPKIVKSDAEWKRQLSANAFDIARRADTEMAYTGSYLNLHQPGIFRCICCDTALFSSRNEVRFRYRMAELLAADRQGKHCRDGRQQLGACVPL